ncbi:class I adenylate-forming enzyme family protein [Aquisalimonas lutea]|uniref:class I adenylate-forming enzyme family protein n=1 Tax=Aquisalimonas lutea TaxID=1327750 RepID=UPI0025B50130|nr:class I adenylate-forming enzyme family protein [Aquisalimonas lutea]MDN3518715.1 class I adenylate-forming enzyme family protein [Aquisalimonas lutea]
MDAATLAQQPFMSVPELIRIHGGERPEATALCQDDTVVTYGELDHAMDRVAAALQRDGLAPGDVISICAATSTAYAAVFLGALRAGVVPAPLAPSATPASLADMMTDAGARHLFVDADNAAALAPVSERLPAHLVTLDGSDAGLPLADWLTPAGTRPEPVTIDPDGPFNIIYSSGTTGTPKGIVQPHRLRWGHVRRGLSEEYGIGPDSVALVATPLYSNTTLVTFFQTIALGGTLVLMAKFDTRRYLELAAHHRATHTILVPVQYQRLMDDPAFDQYDLSSFQCKLCTSAPFRAELKAEVLRRWPGRLIDNYGMTEGGGVCSLLAHRHPDKLHTVGRPAEGHDIRLIDDDGNEVGPGEAGEVVGHSAGMMLGYHNQPDKTAETEWYAPDGRRFIRTGDIGRFDDDGFLVIIDRKKDMIISGGFNIYPADIEAVLREHDAVSDCSVVGVPSTRWGETPVAFVVPVPGADIDAEALRTWTNEQLGKTQRLADVRFHDELPRSAIGKVLKRDLREAYTPSGTP